MNKADKARMRALHELGCIACHLDGYLGVPTDVHHITDKGYRRLSGGHVATLPLCKWHHQGEPPMDFTASYMQRVRGPSLARTKRLFVERYGNERYLLGLVNELIGAAA